MTDMFLMLSYLSMISLIWSILKFTIITLNLKKDLISQTKFRVYEPTRP